MIGLLLSLAAAAEPPAVSMLAECGFTPVISEKKGAEAALIPFALLFEAPGPGQLHLRSARVYDPKKLIRGLPVTGGVYTKDKKFLDFLTDQSLPISFKIGFSPGQGGHEWLGVIGMSGARTAQDYLASSYIADCTINSTDGAAARFEAMEAGR